jgi:hypothetical protein
LISAAAGFVSDRVFFFCVLTDREYNNYGVHEQESSRGVEATTIAELDQA